MEISEVEHGVILPPKPCEGLSWGMLGVIGDEGNLVKFFRAYGTCDLWIPKRDVEEYDFPLRDERKGVASSICNGWSRYASSFCVFM